MSETSKVCLFDYDEYGVWVPRVTIIFLTYATSSIKTVWSGGDETVFLSSLIKKSRLKKKKSNLLEEYRTESLLSLSVNVHPYADCASEPCDQNSLRLTFYFFLCKYVTSTPRASLTENPNFFGKWQLTLFCLNLLDSGPNGNCLIKES